MRSKIGLFVVLLAGPSLSLQVSRPWASAPRPTQFLHAHKPKQEYSTKQTESEESLEDESGMFTRRPVHVKSSKPRAIGGPMPYISGSDSGDTPDISRRDLLRTSFTSVATGAGLVALATNVLDNSNALDNSILAIPVNASSNFDLQKPQLAPVNITMVAKENRINVTLVCPPYKDCVTVDRVTLNKITVPKAPGWLPSWLTPKPRIVKETANTEVIAAAIIAGSITEMLRTCLLYPLATIKSRVQATEGAKRSMRRRFGIKRQKKLRIKRRLQVLGFTFKRQFREGKLYTGIVPSVLVAVPCTGVYYGIRDVTKRMLNKAIATPTRIDDIAVALTGALVADVISLVIRTPADLLTVRLQVGSVDSDDDDAIAGDWFSDSIKRLPAAILTDLPYLLLRVGLNGWILQGKGLDVGRYEVYYIVTACLCALVTTPFDVARTRILIDSNDDPTDGIDGGSGEGLIRTMNTVAREGDVGYRNLFRGWFERVSYLGIGRAWIEPLQIIYYVAIRDAILLEFF